MAQDREASLTLVTQWCLLRPGHPTLGRTMASAFHVGPVVFYTPFYKGERKGGPFVTPL